MSSVRTLKTLQEKQRNGLSEAEKEAWKRLNRAVFASGSAFFRPGSMIRHGKRSYVVELCVSDGYSVRVLFRTRRLDGDVPIIPKIVKSGGLQYPFLIAWIRRLIQQWKAETSSKKKGKSAKTPDRSCIPTRGTLHLLMTLYQEALASRN